MDHAALCARLVHHANRLQALGLATGTSGNLSVRTTDGMLHRAHHMQVEEAIEEAHLQRLHRIIRQQAHRAFVRQMQILDAGPVLTHGNQTLL